MKIAPVIQNQTNFKGAQSKGAKYSQEVLNAISTSIRESFTDVLPEAGKAEKEMGPIYNAATDLIAKGIGKLSGTGASKKCVQMLSHFKKPSARMADLASFAITFFYVNNTRKSKKIDEERKMPLMVNNVAVTAVSSTMAALIDKGSDVFLDRVKGAFCEQKGKQVLDKVIEKVPSVAEQGEEKLAQLGKDILNSKEFRKGLRDYTKRVEKAKSLTIFSFTVRFLVTVLMVPVAGKIVEIIKDKQKANQTQQNQATPQKQEVKEKEDDDDNNENKEQINNPSNVSTNPQEAPKKEDDDKEEDDD